MLLTLNQAKADAGPWGRFDHHQDVGDVAKAGTVQYETDRQAYTVSGGGENMWAGQDAFHFVWKQASGSFSLSAAIDWVHPGGNAHRKACLMVRQSLAPDAPYADAVIHGDGLTSLQFREAPGGPTREIQAPVNRPERIRLERQSDGFSLSFARPGGDWESSGCYFRLRLTNPVYVGLAVCAHDNQVIEEARFTQVEFTQPLVSPASSGLRSVLEIVPIASGDRRVRYQSTNHFEAPNWAPDGSYLLFNSQGRIFRLPVAGGAPERLDTGFANRCNNDHGISADGKQLAISDQSQTRQSLIYVLPITGGTPRQITPLGPSYWHGWSPDGATLVIAPSAAANSTFTRSRRPAAQRSGSP